MPMDLQRLLSKGPLPWTLDVPVETSSGHASHGIPKSLNESDSTRVCGGVGSYYEGSIPKSWMAFQYDVLWLLWFETKNVT